MKQIKRFSKCLLIFILVSIAVFLGYVTGTTINNKYFCINKYANLSREKYSDDITQIDYVGKSPESFTPTQVYLISLKQSTSKDYVKNLTGEVQISIGVSQYIKATSTKKGDTYSFTNISSSSLYDLAERCTYTPNGEMRIQKGKLSGPNKSEITWTDKYTEYSYDEFTKELGREPINQCQYIVSSKTVTDSSLIKKEHGKYTYEIILDPFYSTFCYVNEISHNSGADKSTISFKYVKLIFTIDETFNLLTQSSTEIYDLEYSGIPVEITTTFEVSMNY